MVHSGDGMGRSGDQYTWPPGWEYVDIWYELTYDIIDRFLGYAIIVVLMILQGIQSTDLGKTTVQVAAQVFGKKARERFYPLFSLLLASVGSGFRLMYAGRHWRTCWRSME